MEDQAYDVLARLADGEGPPLGFTADDLVTRGRRQARSRRLGTAAGGVAGALAVTAAVLPLASFGSDKSSALAPGAHSHTVQADDPACVADVAKLAGHGMALSQPQKKLDLQVCPVLRDVGEALDPAGGHLFQPDGTLRPMPTDVIYEYIEAGSGRGVGASLYWTPDGHVPFRIVDSAPSSTGPVVTIDVSLLTPGSDPFANGAADHEHPGLTGNGKAADPVPWGPASVSTLPDGSTVSVRKEQDKGGAETVVIRTLPTGERLALEVNGQSGGSGSASNKLPFTDEQLIAAAGVPGLAEAVQAIAASPVGK